MSGMRRRFGGFERAGFFRTASGTRAFLCLAAFLLAAGSLLIVYSVPSLVLRGQGSAKAASSRASDPQEPSFNMFAPAPGSPDAQYAAEPPETEEEPAFESLNLTERDELGLGRERRDHPGEDGMQADDVPDETGNPYPEGSTNSFYEPGYVPKYRAELSDPDNPERMEVFLADSDTEAIKIAREYCTGEIRLLELHEVDYESCEPIRTVDLTHADRFTIEMPKTGLTETAIDNLIKLVESKAGLIKKAVGAESLPVDETEHTLRFPWFSADITPEEVNAYTHLIAALCKMAKEQKRITAKEKPVDNEKYAFRCFLLRLGFIGEDTKQARKLLLSRMDGNGSFKNGERKPTENAEPEAPADSAVSETNMDSLEETLADAELIHAVNASFETENGGSHE
jgi:hypothetical protein